MKKWAATSIVCIALAWLGSNGLAQAFDTDAALSELGGLGEGSKKNLDKPENYVPKYNTDQTGNGDLYGEGELIPTDPGNAKIAGCKSDPANPNLYDRQECEGVNFVSKNRNVRPNISITTKDPIIVANREITSDPRATLEKYKWIVPVNADGSVGTVPANACTGTTVVTQAVVEERRCTFYKGAENFLCKSPLKVVVVPQFNYQCQDTLGVNKNEVCSKILKVSCTRVCAPFISAVHPVKPTFTSFKDEIITISGPDSNRVTRVSLSGKFLGTQGFVINFNTQDPSKVNYIKVVSAGSPIVDDGRGGPYNSYSCKYQGSNKNSAIRDSSRSNRDGLDYFGNSPCLTVGLDFKQFLVSGTNKNAYYYNGNLPLIIEYQEKEDPTLCPAPTCTTNWDNQCTSLEDRAK